MILADDDNSYDGADELWARGIVNYPVGDFGQVSISITALDGRLNINRLVGASGNIDSVVKKRFLRLFDILDIDNAPTHVDTLVDWLDPDDDPEPSGAEAAYYALQTPATHCKNGPLDTLDELKLVAGFTSEDVDKLRPHVSVHGGSKVHLNSASAEVLYSLAEEIDLSTAQMIVDQRKQASYQSLEELKLLPNWEAFYWALNSHLQVVADYYRIDTDAVVSDGRRRARASVKKQDNSLLYFEIL